MTGICQDCHKPCKTPYVVCYTCNENRKTVNIEYLLLRSNKKMGLYKTGTCKECGTKCDEKYSLCYDCNKNIKEVKTIPKKEFVSLVLFIMYFN